MKALFVSIFTFIFLTASSLYAQNAATLKKQHDQAYKNPEKISKEIQLLCEHIAEDHSLQLGGEHIHSNIILTEIYSDMNYKPVWSDYTTFVQGIEIIEESYFDGLNPDDYHADGLEYLAHKINFNKTLTDDEIRLVAAIDVMLTDGVLQYAAHLLMGKVNPYDLDVDWNYDEYKINPAAHTNFVEIIRQGNVKKQIQSLRPEMDIYGTMMELLAEYRMIAENGGWNSIEAGGKIDTGDTDARIPDIRKRLLITGDLSDTTSMSNTSYDKQLESDIRDFQEDHILAKDGVIGKGTFEALNMPVEELIVKIRATLERSRWVAHNPVSNLLLVNIAEYTLYVFSDEKEVWDSRVMTGTTYHKSPVFKARLQYVEFNPTWTVPVSITRREMVAKIKADPNYLDDHHFEVLDASGKIVPSSSIDRDAISKSYFPYTLRQKAGPWNALGQVKFIFPNKHSVFLHDTQAKSLFNTNKRAFSHGCIRVENPLDLAEIILDGTEYDQDRIDQVIESKKTIRAFPDKEYDVMLLYWTCGTYDDGRIFYAPDVYDRDGAVIVGLDAVVKTGNANSF